MLRVFTLLLVTTVTLAQHPRDGQIHDSDTLAWWHTTEALSGDSMEGRDTGSAGYQRAAEYVSRRFRDAGLKPAGDSSTFLQPVPLQEIAAEREGTRFLIERPGKSPVPIPFLQQITLSPQASLPEHANAALIFRGYCGKQEMAEIEGKIVLCFGTQRAGLPTGAERAANARAGRALGILTVDDPSFSLEPPRWPVAYARTVSIESRDVPVVKAAPLLSMRLSADALPLLLAGSGKDADVLLSAGGRQQPLPSFDLTARLRVDLHLTRKSYASPNVLALLPGTDPALKGQYLVLSAHLDGYGYGTPVDGDPLYNGALDDAAYVALLIQLADDLHAQHRALKRPVLFCAFTGEEKGLLGSTYFTQQPPVPLAALAADINLDQLRPLFPLRLLTALAIDDSTLGATARQVGAIMGITLRADPEPERNLLRRADHYPFLRKGVPAIGFIFGYEPGTPDEQRYREWYRVRYHRPQDDLTQPVDFDAAAKFNQFFYALAEAVADASARPVLLSGSSFAPKP